MSETIRIGTRASKLALWQANHVAGLLQKGGLSTEIVAMETKGDKILNTPFSEIGTKGLFTEELEEKLLTGEIDIAVHSAKDMQSELPEGLEILSFTRREEANDVVISFDKNFTLNDQSRDWMIGTSSTRRRAVLRHYYPHLQVTDARGNLQTRMRKMEEGKFHAMILAFAGVHRMNYDEYIVEKLPLTIFTPAVGQGSIAVESSSTVKKEKRDLVRRLTNDLETEYCLLSERAFLRKLQGGCSIPVFALAQLEGEHVKIEGGVISLDGTQMVRDSVRDIKQNAAQAGTRLAEIIYGNGGDHILAEIKKER